MYSYNDFLKAQQFLLPQINVSRETFERLNFYVNRVIEYNQKFNLIGSKEEEKIWERHVFDSMQLFSYIESDKKVCDIGSGAGFPGLVLGIIGISNISLIESNEKKARFLESVSRETSVDNKIICGRVEILEESFDIVIARALAPLEKLLNWSLRVSHKKTYCIFPKGKIYQEEIKRAYKKFAFDVSLHHSVTNEDGKILVVKNVHKNHCCR